MLALDVLVVGAGMSGLIAATELQKSGFSVACVEKSRGSGGRLSSKRIEFEKNKSIIKFDLGCASFGATTELFRSRVEYWISLGIAKVWRFSDSAGSQYVATPRSSSITRYLADQLDVYFATRVTEIRKDNTLWSVYTGEIGQRTLFAQAKNIIFATPPQQTADLLPYGHSFIAALSQPILLPQWVLMLKVKGHLALNDDYYEFTDSIISRLILEQSKPGRSESDDYQVWVVQADIKWTADNLETNKSSLEHALLAELMAKTGSPIIVDGTYLHRWLYSVAQPSELTGKMFLNDADGLWICGDYLADTTRLSGVEAAFTSGYYLAKNYLAKNYLAKNFKPERSEFIQST
tara:strand:+ start:2306 stop:3352 length:1047 start_codon:yes stop_codon:yes gene_type:complete